MKVLLNLYKDDLLCPWILYLSICSFIRLLIHFFMMIVSSGWVKSRVEQSKDIEVTLWHLPSGCVPRLGR